MLASTVMRLKLQEFIKDFENNVGIYEDKTLISLFEVKN